MFRYDHPHTELDWRYEADARELAELDRDRQSEMEGREAGARRYKR